MKVKTLQKIWIYFVLLNICILYFDKLTLAYKQIYLGWNMNIKNKTYKITFFIYNIQNNKDIVVCFKF